MVGQCQSSLLGSSSSGVSERGWFGTTLSHIKRSKNFTGKPQAQAQQCVASNHPVLLSQEFLPNAETFTFCSKQIQRRLSSNDLNSEQKPTLHFLDRMGLYVTRHTSQHNYIPSSLHTPTTRRNQTPHPYPPP